MSNLTWDSMNDTWDSIIEVTNFFRRTGNSGGISDYIKGNPWNKVHEHVGKEKTERYIKIFCKINNLEYSEVINPNSKIKITMGQVERVFNETIKVSIKLN